MESIENLQPKRVFYYFNQINKIPRGSKNMKAVSKYCKDFAIAHGLKYIQDDAENVVIFKPASDGYENSQPVILQGHLDMVCQKKENSEIDFEKDGIEMIVNGDFVCAKNTTLGADNGIAVAMILAILEDESCAHPPIEAVFTTDEEIGMIGALKLDMSCLKAKRMINLDSEEEGVVTVSCAGGEDFWVKVNSKREKKNGNLVNVCIKGLRGGHSGVEINSGRVNADLLMGRLLDSIGKTVDFDIVSINGGDKSNAIPNSCAAKLCVCDTDAFENAFKASYEIIKNEISCREKDFNAEVQMLGFGDCEVFEKEIKENLLLTLLSVPNGVVQMSAQIENLVETSLNFGILKTTADGIEICISLRSNIKSAQKFLQRRLEAFFDFIGWKNETSGGYPPWEFNEKSYLKEVFCDAYFSKCGKNPEIAAIHAGLECGVFASAIDDMDCISVGPEMFDVHTTDERLSISSVGRLFDILTDVLKKLK